MRHARILILSVALWLAALALGMLVGAKSISLSNLWAPENPALQSALLDARLPRVILGAIAGGGLATAGVAFQSVLRNPLAEPYVLGVSGGSALGATVAMIFGAQTLTWLGASVVPLAALLGGSCSTVLVYALVQRWPDGRHAILLAGVIVNAIASALITFIKTLVSASRAQELLYWLTGYLDVHPWHEIAMTGFYVGLGALVLVRDAGRLNLLALGSENAMHLGVDVRALERRTLLAGSLVVGATVSVTGLIGFVGLLVPHALRRLWGPDARTLLPASFFVGGATLVLCDSLSRLLFRFLHTEPPVGAVTALLGGPLFLVLMTRNMRA